MGNGRGWRGAVLFAMSIGCGAGQGRAEPMLGVDFDGEVYHLNSDPLSATLISNTAPLRLNSLARDPTGSAGYAGHFYSIPSVDTTSATLYRISAVDGAATSVASVSFAPRVASVRGMAFSPSGVLYALNNLGGSATIFGANHLYTIDVQSGQTTFIGDTGTIGIQGLAFSPEGVLYGYSFNTLGLMTIDTATGVATDVNSDRDGAAIPNTIQTLAFSPGGTLYASDGRLFTIDPQTGVETVLGPHAGVRGMEFIPEPTGAAAMAVGLLVAAATRRRRQD